MRFYLREDERRPDPAPVATDDRIAVTVGLIAWIAATAVVAALGLSLWTCAAGLAIGVALLVYAVGRRRQRSS